MSTADEQAIEEARQQIRALVDEIDVLSRSNLAEADFFRGLLDRVIEAMGAVAGLVWLIGEQGRVEPVCHAGMPGTGLTDEKESQEAHGRLVQTLIGNPAGLIVPPRAGLTGPDGKPAADNPTDLLVISSPIEQIGRAHV